MQPPGTPVWFEVNTRDSEGVRDFFTGLFGNPLTLITTRD
jgi:predicted enzyme related to lactoylglutathione lyase